LICVHTLILDWNLEQTVGRSKVEVELPDDKATIANLLESLDSQYEGKFAEAASKSSLFILVNGQDIEFLNGRYTKLSYGASVAMIPLVAGG
jgi:molybdopterin converting factor small subunit